MDGHFPSDHSEEGAESGAIIAIYEASKSKPKPRFFDVAEYVTIIEHYLERFDIPSATAAIRHAQAQHPGSMELKYHQAHLAYVMGDADTCLQLVSTLRLIQPEDIDLEMLRAEALAMKGEHQRALRNFQRIEREYEDVDEFKLQHLMARLHMELGHHLDAIPHWKRLVEDSPKYDHGYVEMADCYLNAELPQEALTLLDQALDHNPYSVQLWMEKGSIHFSEEEFEAAISAFEYCMAIDEDFRPAKLNAASCYFNLDQFLASLTIYQECLEDDQDDAVVLCCIGECYEQMEDMERAEAFFRRSLRIDPEHAEARMGMCVVHESRGEHLHALRHIENAVGLCPEVAEYWQVYGAMLARTDDYNRAMVALERASQLDEDDVRPYLEMLDLQIAHAHFEEVLLKIQLGYEKYGDEVGIYLRGIQTLHLMGRREECVSLLAMSRERCPRTLVELNQHYPAIYQDAQMAEHL